MKHLIENLNALVAVSGFIAFEAGIALHWSVAMALIVGGLLCMVGGSWVYIAYSIRAVRKRAT